MTQQQQSAKYGEIIPQPAQPGTYYEKSFITFWEKARIRASLIVGGWQHIRIEDVRGGYTEIHAIKAREVRP